MIAFLRFGFVLCIHVIPFMLTAILLLSSRYSRIIFKVLWLTCFGSFLFSSGIVMRLSFMVFSVFSTIMTVFRVGECSNLCS